MKPPDPLPSLEFLKGICRYEPDSGNFYVTRNGRERLITCPPSNRYLVLWFRRKPYYVHRLAWKLFYGHDPDGLIDHIDRNKLNNKIKNLRVVTVYENSQNRDPSKPGAKGLPTGVYFDKSSKLYRAVIRSRGVKTYLGSFRNAEEAGNAYVRARLALRAELSSTTGFEL